MATLLLAVVGRAILGPVGGIIGTLVGGSLDRQLLGGSRSGPRLANPEIQAASYGEPIPVVRGRMRVSGNVIWAAGIKETSARSGGGKRGPSTTNYSYSASFAVVLCAGPISDVGRVWADGRLIRDADGQWLMPATMRLHKGSERQPPDPLIAAAEAATPAFRGLAYVVFEDLQLADFGNRLPNLAVEVIADSGPVALNAAVAALAARADIALPTVGQFAVVEGLYAGAAGPLADLLSPIMRSTGAVLAAGQTLVGQGTARRNLAGPVDSDAHGPGKRQPQERQRRAAAGSAPDAVELGYYDVDRDFQPGLQRARLRGGVRVEGDGLPVALHAAAAKQLAHDRLLRQHIGRQRRTLRLPWRHLGVMPGDVLRLDSADWQVTECRFEGFVLALELTRVPELPAPALTSDGGQALDHGDGPAGATILAIIDPPPLPGELPDRPRLWLAAAGAAAGWRRAAIEISHDGGATFGYAGTVSTPVAMGRAASVLPAASAAGWDRLGTVEVELLAEAMWLESRPETSVLAGANLAMLGDEIIQFRDCQALGGRRFRLSGLLRGRRGTEWAVAGHRVDERFVMLDAEAMLALTFPLERLGEGLLVRAIGSGDGTGTAIAAMVGGAALQPLAPVHLAWQRNGTTLQMRWIPASRAGFGWPDLTDVPSGEMRSAWRVRLRDGGGVLAEAEVDSPLWVVPDRAGPLWLDVAQIGATLGRATTLAID